MPLGQGREPSALLQEGEMQEVAPAKVQGRQVLRDNQEAGMENWRG